MVLFSRLADLRRELAHLRYRLDAVERQAPPSNATAVPAPPPLDASPPVASVTPPRRPPASELSIPSPGLGSSVPPRDPPTTPPEQPAKPRTPPTRIDWERWIGVRGFAVLGGAVLALAGVLFVRELANRGYFSPAARVATTALVGLASLGAGPLLRRRGYAVTANALAGAGVVLLYGAVWAAHRLFALLASPYAFVAMAGITGLCGYLAWRHRAAVIAGLGLTGGFLTPLLVSTGHDDPLGLFGYLLILDAGALFLMRRNRWPGLAAACLAATALYQVAWLAAGLAPADHILALGILAATSAVFLYLSWPGEPVGRESRGWRGLRTGALVVPFAFGLYFAGRADLDPGFVATAVFVALLSVAVLWLDHKRTLPVGASDAAALGGLGLFAMWAWRHAGPTETAWTAVAIAVGMVAPFHIAFLVHRSRGVDLRPPQWHRPAVVAATGHLLVLLTIGNGPPGWLGPWLVGCVVLAASLIVQARDAARRVRQVIAGAGLGLALGWHDLGTAAARPAWSTIGWFLVLAGCFLVLGGRPGRPRTTRGAAFGFAMVALLGIGGQTIASQVDGWPLATLLLITVATAHAAAAWAPFGRGALAATILGIVVVWVGFAARASPAGITALLVAVALGMVGPLVTAALRGRRFGAFGAIIAAPLALLPLDHLWQEAWGTKLIGIGPLVLGTLALMAAGSAERITGDALRRQLQVRLLAVAAAMAGLALPRQLEHHWGTIGLAVAGLALVLVWRRFPRPEIESAGVVALVLAAVALVVTIGLDGGRADGGATFWNWLTYRHATVAVALIAAVSILGRTRSTDREPGAGRSRAASVLTIGIAAAITVFAWISMTVFDTFADVGASTLGGRVPARDLTLSLAWALYAMALLALGVRRASAGLRWASLVVLVTTILKVFLYDLGELEGLYRVGSLAGLAISLLLVSLAYQRFVFQAPRESSAPAVRVDFD